MNSKGLLKIAIIATLQCLPTVVLACPNCFGSTDGGVLDTYYFTTAMLSLSPFFVVGGLLWVANTLRRNFDRNIGREPRATKILPLRRPREA